MKNKKQNKKRILTGDISNPPNYYGSKPKIDDTLSKATGRFFDDSTSVKDCITLLRDVLYPFYINCYYDSDNSPIIRELLYHPFRVRLVELRKKYGATWPPVPATIPEIEDWITDVEKALRDYICYVDETTKQVLWEEDNPAYIFLKDAADKSGGLFTSNSLGKLLRRKSNTIRWMNHCQRTKVNRSDFTEHLKTHRKIEQTRERMNSQLTRREANRRRMSDI